MATNSNLQMSRAGKTDEFYTQLTTIENELRHYRKYFNGKTVFCNCDDPYESNFFKYFALNFNSLHLKKLITTCYATSPIMYSQMSLFDDEKIVCEVTSRKKPYKIEITEIKDADGNNTIDLSDVAELLKNDKNVLSVLKGDGDFRSEECIRLLDEADIVVTNPPFSLMKEYLPLLVKKEKKFIILGNMNHATWAETFPYFIENKVWLGVNSGHFWFKVPDYYEAKNTDFKQDENGQKWRRLGNICWFTNLDIEARHIPLDLYKKYTPEEYPCYDTYDAIDCGLVQNIPYDTNKIIGVPLTFLSKYCKEQFKIVGELHTGSGNEYDFAFPKVNGKNKYIRILIKHINPQMEI